MECTICLEPCNKSTKKDSACLFCNSIFCRACLQDTLLLEESIDIHCPNCKVIWNREFIDTICTAVFRNGRFKAHREKVLVDSERIRLPTSQEDAIRYQTATKYIEGYESIYLTAKHKLDRSSLSTNIGRIEYEFKKSRDSLWCESNTIRRNHEYNRHEGYTWTSCKSCMELYLPIEIKYRTLKIDLQKQLAEARKMYKESANYISFEKLKEIYISRTTIKNKELIRSFGYETPTAEAPIVEKRAFIKACPVTDCRGFLSTQWKCGICDIKVCNKCHDPMTIEPHLCDEEKVASVALIAAEAKPCPKCGVMISKVSGCSQMFCVECKTAFSWTTGKIETGIIHNPHYFEWRRAAGADPAPIGPAGRLICGIDQGDMIVILSRKAIVNPLYDIIYSRYISTQHYHYVLQGLQREIAPQHPYADIRRIFRVRYLTKEITEEEWKIALQKHEKQVHLTQSRAHLVEMFLAAFRDIMNTFATAKPEDMISQMNELFLFTIGQYEAINKRYNSKVHIKSYIPVWNDAMFTPPKKEKKIRKATTAVIEEED